MVLLLIMWSPALQSCSITAVIAPMPLAVTFALSVPSNAARASPKYKLEGEECLLYK